MQAWPWLWKIAKAEPLTAAVEIGIVEHDVGALAAELELHAFQVAGRGLRRSCGPSAVEPVNAILSHAAGARRGTGRRRAIARHAC